MNKKDAETLAATARLAGRSADIAAAIERICMAWSNGTSRTLRATYDCVEEHDAAELDDFMSVLAAMVRAGEN